MHKYWATWLIAGCILIGAAGFGSYEYIYSQDTKKAEIASSKSKKSSQEKQKSVSHAKAKFKQSAKKKSETSTSTEGSSHQVTATSTSTSSVQSDAASMDVATFIGKYGMTYARYLREHDGMSVAQSLQTASSIGAGMTSGEMQNMYGLEQGRLTETADGKLVETDATNETDDSTYAEKARTPNADFTLEDGTHIHNDANGDSFDEKGQKIGKGD
ncbi:hypothetical protein [Weissella viridescens]|uniref:hypothetical protein n=1 Tax=Weissella viridescens TaxID=1629 RepID=UPI00092E4623|nr:hypothetical protein [Weissella viridescens]